MDYQSKHQHVIVNCGQRLDVDTILDQKKMLIAVLATKKPIILKANQLDHVDTAALQLLLSFILEARRQFIQLTWQEPSTTLIHIADLLGLKELLELSAK